MFSMVFQILSCLKMLCQGSWGHPGAVKDKWSYPDSQCWVCWPTILGLPFCDFPCSTTGWCWQLSRNRPYVVEDNSEIGSRAHSQQLCQSHPARQFNGPNTCTALALCIFESPAES